MLILIYKTKESIIKASAGLSGLLVMAAVFLPATADAATKCTKDGCDLIAKYVNPTINLLSVSFGLLAIISLILGSINYATSEGDPQKASKAKQRIVNTIFAVVAYLFLYAFLQFLVPGGAFR